MRHVAAARRERGGAMLAIMVVVLVVIGGWMLYDTMRDNPRLASDDRTTTPRLAEAREALIGHAKAQWCLKQTGAVADHLPCPDMGASEGQAATGCSGTTVGRLPWRTLGLPALRDAAGECLWYERSATGARIVAPGSVQGAQARTGSGAAPVCGGTYDASQYVETGGNDIVLTIAASDLVAPTGCTSMPPPPPPPSGTCTSDANVLLAHVSGNNNGCRVFPNGTAPACTAAANQLASAGCSCAAAANTFINPPCRNNLNPPQCQAAIASLQSCS